MGLNLAKVRNMDNHCRTEGVACFFSYKLIPSTTPSQEESINTVTCNKGNPHILFMEMKLT